MTDSKNDTSKCLSGIVRRLLCTGTLPTHPSDSICAEPTNNNPEKDSKNEVIKPQDPSTPGIIARLMGLDTLPDFNWVPKHRTLESFLRSRSVNSVNYLPEFDLTTSNHRRVRTSVSFREENTSFLQHKDSDFFVFRFEEVGGSSNLSLSCGKSDMGLEELKQGKVETERNRRDVREKKSAKNNKKKVSERNKEQNHRVGRRFSSKVDNVNLPCRSISEEGLEELKQREVEIKINRGNSGEINRGNSGEINRGNSGERESENKKVSEKKGEKNSVRKNFSSKIDNVDFLGKNKVVGSKTRVTLKGKSGVKALNQKEIGTRNKKKSESKRKAKEVEAPSNSENSSPVSVIDLHNIFRHRQTSSPGDSRAKISKSMELSSSGLASRSDLVFVGEDDLKPKKTRETLKYYSEVLIEIFRLSEQGINESNWVGKKVVNSEDVEEIYSEFGQQILDLLLNQVVYELAGCDINLF